MNQPVMDPRTKESLMEQLKLLAQAYTPAWRYEQGDPSDPGAAIVSLFGELFSQTIDRFNQLPGKYYTEFLNLLGVQSPSLNPAAGLGQFLRARKFLRLPLEVARMWCSPPSAKLRRLLPS